MALLKDTLKDDPLDPLQALDAWYEFRDEALPDVKLQPPLIDALYDYMNIQAEESGIKVLSKYLPVNFLYNRRKEAAKLYFSRYREKRAALYYNF